MLGVVAAAEYWRRISSKAFVLTTLLGPLAVLVLVGGAVAALNFSVQSEAERERDVAVYDPSGRILPRLRQGGHEQFRLSAQESFEEARQAVAEGRIEIFVALPADIGDPAGTRPATIYADGPLSLRFESALGSALRTAVRRERLSGFELPPAALEAMDARLAVETVTVSDDGVQATGLEPLVVGFGLSTLLLVVMAVYGGLVMQTAMEEKTSRMAEVLVSSVRPFDLMMGKIVAVAGLACTQLAVWLAMLAAVGTVAGLVLPVDDVVQFGVASELETGEAALHIPLRGDVALVVLFMLPLGFLINASLFAALGALYETAQEAQVGVSIAMAPLVATPIIVQTVRLAPESMLLTFASVFPLSAPVVLPTRMLMGDVPAWQTAASMVLCFASAIATVWLAGRVFRGSLLNYGRRPSFRDVWRVLRE